MVRAQELAGRLFHKLEARGDLDEKPTESDLEWEAQVEATIEAEKQKALQEIEDQKKAEELKKQKVSLEERRKSKELLLQLRQTERLLNRHRRNTNYYTGDHNRHVDNSAAPNEEFLLQSKSSASKQHQPVPPTTNPPLSPRASLLIQSSASQSQQSIHSKKSQANILRKSLMQGGKTKKSSFINSSQQEVDLFNEMMNIARDSHIEDLVKERNDETYHLPSFSLAEFHDKNSQDPFLSLEPTYFPERTIDSPSYALSPRTPFEISNIKPSSPTVIGKEIVSTFLDPNDDYCKPQFVLPETNTVFSPKEVKKFRTMASSDYEFDATAYDVASHVDVLKLFSGVDNLSQRVIDMKRRRWRVVELEKQRLKKELEEKEKIEELQKLIDNEAEKVAEKEKEKLKIVRRPTTLTSRTPMSSRSTTAGGGRSTTPNDRKAFQEKRMEEVEHLLTTLLSRVDLMEQTMDPDVFVPAYADPPKSPKSPKTPKTPKSPSFDPRRQTTDGNNVSRPASTNTRFGRPTRKKSKLYTQLEAYLKRIKHLKLQKYIKRRRKQEKLSKDEVRNLLFYYQSLPETEWKAVDGSDSDNDEKEAKRQQQEEERLLNFLMPTEEENNLSNLLGEYTDMEEVEKMIHTRNEETLTRTPLTAEGMKVRGTTMGTAPEMSSSKRMGVTRGASPLSGPGRPFSTNDPSGWIARKNVIMTKGHQAVPMATHVIDGTVLIPRTGSSRDRKRGGDHPDQEDAWERMTDTLSSIMDPNTIDENEVSIINTVQNSLLSVNVDNKKLEIDAKYSIMEEGDDDEESAGRRRNFSTIDERNETKSTMVLRSVGSLESSSFDENEFIQSVLFDEDDDIEGGEQFEGHLPEGLDENDLEFIRANQRRKKKKSPQRDRRKPAIKGTQQELDTILIDIDLFELLTRLVSDIPDLIQDIETQKDKFFKHLHAIYRADPFLKEKEDEIEQKINPIPELDPLLKQHTQTVFPANRIDPTIGLHQNIPEDIKKLFLSKSQNKAPTYQAPVPHVSPRTTNIKKKVDQQPAVGPKRFGIKGKSFPLPEPSLQKKSQNILATLNPTFTQQRHGPNTSISSLTSDNYYYNDTPTNQPENDFSPRAEGNYTEESSFQNRFDDEVDLDLEEEEMEDREQENPFIKNDDREKHRFFDLSQENVNDPFAVVTPRAFDSTTSADFPKLQSLSTINHELNQDHFRQVINSPTSSPPAATAATTAMNPSLQAFNFLDAFSHPPLPEEVLTISGKQVRVTSPKESIRQRLSASKSPPPSRPVSSSKQLRHHRPASPTHASSNDHHLALIKAVMRSSSPRMEITTTLSGREEEDLGHFQQSLSLSLHSGSFHSEVILTNTNSVFPTVSSSTRLELPTGPTATENTLVPVSDENQPNLSIIHGENIQLFNSQLQSTVEEVPAVLTADNSLSAEHSKNLNEKASVNSNNNSVVLQQSSTQIPFDDNFPEENDDNDEIADTLSQFRSEFSVHSMRKGGTESPDSIHSNHSQRVSVRHSSLSPSSQQLSAQNSLALDTFSVNTLMKDLNGKKLAVPLPKIAPPPRSHYADNTVSSISNMKKMNKPPPEANPNIKILSGKDEADHIFENAKSNRWNYLLDYLEKSFEIQQQRRLSPPPSSSGNQEEEYEQQQNHPKVSFTGVKAVTISIDPSATKMAVDRPTTVTQQHPESTPVSSAAFSSPNKRNRKVKVSSTSNIGEDVNLGTSFIATVGGKQWNNPL
jgi:hypothetical protein